MATIYKVLGQLNPAATTASDLYTVPAATSAVCSTVAICNTGTSTSYRIAIRPAGATLVNAHYIVFDALLEQYTSVLLTLGITLAATDVITVYADSANVSFSVFGSEITIP
jgi:hypothetical protein